MDDPFVSCPYDQSHRVPRSRIQAHLVRCKKKDPSYVICPYNATHRFPDHHIKEHVLNCPSKETIFPSKFYDKKVTIKPEDIKVKKIIVDEEMWDD